MAEIAQTETASPETASTQTATTQGGHGQTGVTRARRDPALQPLDPRPLRNVHHGQTGAMWVTVTLVFVGFLVGGIGMLLGPNWALFVIGCVLCVVGIAAGLVMQALGFGLYEKKKS